MGSAQSRVFLVDSLLIAHLDVPVVRWHYIYVDQNIQVVLFSLWQDDLGNDTGFLPQYHLLKLLEGDMERLVSYFFLAVFVCYSVDSLVSGFLGFFSVCVCKFILPKFTLWQRTVAPARRLTLSPMAARLSSRGLQRRQICGDGG
jgi:hypothetical protein